MPPVLLEDDVHCLPNLARADVLFGESRSDVAGGCLGGRVRFVECVLTCSFEEAEAARCIVSGARSSRQILRKDSQ